MRPPMQTETREGLAELDSGPAEAFGRSLGVDRRPNRGARRLCRPVHKTNEVVEMAGIVCPTLHEVCSASKSLHSDFQLIDSVGQPIQPDLPAGRFGFSATRFRCPTGLLGCCATALDVPAIP